MPKPTYQKLLGKGKVRYPHTVDELIALAKYYNDMFELPENLVPAAMMKESDFDHMAKSKTGPLGLMQMGKASRFETGVSNPFDAEESLMGGAAYYRHLMDDFKAKPKNIKHLSTMYTEGPGAGGEMVRGKRPYNEQALSHYQKIKDAIKKIGLSDDIIESYREPQDVAPIKGNPMEIVINHGFDGDYSEGALEDILKGYGFGEPEGLSTKKYMELPKKARDILERFKRLDVEPLRSLAELPPEYDQMEDLMNAVSSFETVPTRW
jgi:hypothetical protein